MSLKANEKALKGNQAKKNSQKKSRKINVTGKNSINKITDKEEKNNKTKSPPKITIHSKLCKGCGICIAFCPTQVLAFHSGKAAVVNLEACTACTFCELRCPDFAIVVED